MKKIYLKLFRRSYRMLRHPRIREIGWLNSIVKKFYARQYWKPCVRSIAVGLSIGLFCAMLPMPFQMLLAAFCCFMGNGNIPIALSACWISNPFTQIPLMYMQLRIGTWVRTHIDWEILEKLDYEGTLPFINVLANLGSFFMGVGITAITMGIIAYPIVYLIYALTPKHKIKSTDTPPHFPTDKI